MPKPVSPTTILQFLHEVRKRLPEGWIKNGATYSATAEATYYGREDEVEYRIYVTPPRGKAISITRNGSVRAALVELEDAIKGFPALSI